MSDSEEKREGAYGLNVGTYEEGLQHVGKPGTVRQAPVPVNDAMIRQFLSAVRDANPIYWDAELAQKDRRSVGLTRRPERVELGEGAPRDVDGVRLGGHDQSPSELVPGVGSVHSSGMGLPSGCVRLRTSATPGRRAKPRLRWSISMRPSALFQSAVETSSTVSGPVSPSVKWRWMAVSPLRLSELGCSSPVAR